MCSSKSICAALKKFCAVEKNAGKIVTEIINNTRGGIEGRIGERDDWGGKFKSRMFTHSRCPRQKKSF